ncbi:hypothetical protein ACX8XP_01770 [Calditrichota bacterium LG25]
MKISSNNWSVKNLEKTYQQVSPRVEKTQPAKTAQRLKGLSRLTAFTKSKKLLPQDILSLDEKITLKRLFEDQASFNFYGKSNRPGAISGMLLDVTG